MCVFLFDELIKREYSNARLKELQINSWMYTHISFINSTALQTLRRIKHIRFQIRGAVPINDSKAEENSDTLVIAYSTDSNTREYYVLHYKVY